MIYYADQLKLVPIDLPENFTLSKVIQEHDGMKQKVDEGGNALFTKYETVQKKDQNGSLLYLDFDTGMETLCPQRVSAYIEREDEDGFLVQWPTEWIDNDLITIEVPVETTAPRVATAWETQTVPDITYIQKVDAEGNPLYYLMCLDEDGNESMMETTESTFLDDEYEVELEPVLIPIEGTKDIQVEIEWLEYDPCMVPNMVDVTVSFVERPEQFTVEEIITQKYTMIAQELGYEYCIADCFLTEDDLDLTAPGHSADTGVKTVSIQPNGMCQTKIITSEVLIGEYKLYLEADANVIASVFIEYNTVAVTFHETDGKRGNVRAYALFYNEEVAQ